MARPLVIVFARAPRYGAVKTRLAREVGAPETLRFYRNVLAGLIRRVRDDARWETVLCVTPDMAANEAARWPLRATAQGGGDLGRRMARALRAAGPRPAVIVGSDIPGLEAQHISSAFGALRCRPYVLGPARDGGYWLIGARGALQMAPNALDGVRWSSVHTLIDTVARLRNPAILDTMLEDIDEADSYRHFMRAAAIRAAKYERLAGTPAL